MRYSITSNDKSLSMNWEKYVFHWKKWNFEPIMNSAHTAELLALLKTLNENMDYLIYYPSRQHVKWKQFKCKFTFNNDVMKKKELCSCKF